MKKIVKGNDFTLRIPVMKMVEGEAQAFPLPACTDVVVQVCNQFKRIPLAYEIDVKEDNVLLAKVEGDQMSIGTYAIEVKGKIFGNDWRSNEYPSLPSWPTMPMPTLNLERPMRAITAWRWIPLWLSCLLLWNCQTSFQTQMRR